MTGQGAFRTVAALTAALAGVPALAQQTPGIVDFLGIIGGDTDVKTSGSLRSDPAPQIYPLLDDATEIIGYRFFSEKLTANGSATAERARDPFAQECTVTGGRIEPEGSDIARPFRERTLGKRLPPRGGYKHFWSGISSVCSREAGQVLGGFVAITYEATEVATKGRHRGSAAQPHIDGSDPHRGLCLRPRSDPRWAVAAGRQAAANADIQPNDSAARASGASS